MYNNKTCKNCGKQISGDFKFCPYCEAKIEEQNFSESNSNEKVCKNCGKMIKSDFNVCPYCRNKVDNQTVNENLNEKICKSCGKSINANFKVCPYCGNNPNNKRENYNNYNTENRTNYYSNNYEIYPKSGIACSILCLFLGGFGVHRFYVGRIISAVIFLLLTSISIVLAIIIFILSLNNGDIFADIFNSVLNLFVTLIGLLISIWTRIDVILIILGKFKDSKGRYIKINN